MLTAETWGGPDYGLGSIMPERREDEPQSPLIELRIAQAVTNQKVEEVGRLVNELRQEVRELKTTFVTRNELEPIRLDLKELQDWQRWILRGIVGLFLSGIASIIYVKGGVPHP